MTPDGPARDLVVVAFLVFLGVGGVLLASSVRRGRTLCDELARRHPAEYERLGRPRPGYFDSARRNAYLRFVLQRGFAALEDPVLVEAFARLRRSELRQLVFLLAGFGALGLAALGLELTGGGVRVP